MRLTIYAVVLWAVPIAVNSQASESKWQMMRDQLVNEIKQDMRRARHYLGYGELNVATIEALSAVARHEFVPADFQRDAYNNHPLPIGEGQTISQPFIVALMTDLLQVDSGSRVLEVGTGSGYQAAVLAELVDQVYSVEIVGALAERARNTLSRLGYTNVYVRHGDGTRGWQEQAPFDGIIVTAAGIELPDELLDQLAPGGTMVMPVGAQHETQQLKVIKRALDGSFEENDALPVRFVPITTEVR